MRSITYALNCVCAQLLVRSITCALNYLCAQLRVRFAVNPHPSAALPASPGRGRSGARTNLLPGIPVEHSVVDGLAEMVVLDVVGAVDVCDRAGQAENFVVGAGGQAQFVDADL